MLLKIPSTIGYAGYDGFLLVGHNEEQISYDEGNQEDTWNRSASGCVERTRLLQFVTTKKQILSMSTLLQTMSFQWKNLQ